MNQGNGSGNNKSVTEPGAQEESPRYPTEKQHTKAWGIFGNVIGIVMGVLVFLAGLGALIGLPGVWWVGMIALFVSVCLFVPSRVYEHRIVHAIGLLALILGTAVSVDFAVFSGYCAFGFLSDLHDEFAGLVAVIGVGSLIISAFAVSCTCVLVFKVKPRPAHAAIGIAAGIALGALMSYLLYFQD
jgi:hypothetical protein